MLSNDLCNLLEISEGTKLHIDDIVSKIQNYIYINNLCISSSSVNPSSSTLENFANRELKIKYEKLKKNQAILLFKLDNKLINIFKNIVLTQEDINYIILFRELTEASIITFKSDTKYDFLLSKLLILKTSLENDKYLIYKDLKYYLEQYLLENGYDTNEFRINTENIKKLKKDLDLFKKKVDELTKEIKSDRKELESNINYVHILLVTFMVLYYICTLR